MNRQTDGRTDSEGLADRWTNKLKERRNNGQKGGRTDTRGSPGRSTAAAANQNTPAGTRGAGDGGRRSGGKISGAAGPASVRVAI